MQYPIPVRSFLSATFGRRQRLLDGTASELVTKREAGVPGNEQTALDALIDRRGAPARDRRQQGDVAPLPEHRGRREDSPPGRRQSVRPGQDRVAHGRGNLGRTTRDQLGQEERVTFCNPLHLPDHERRMRSCEHLRDRIRTQRLQLQTAHARRRGQRAQRQGQRVSRAHLVRAEGGDQQHRHPVQPPPAMRQQVEGRTVGPVDILENQGRRPVLEHLAQGAEQDAPHQRRRPGDQIGQLRHRLEHRSERLRGREAVADTPADRARSERGFDQGRLAHAGLAADQDQPALPGRCLPGRHVQRGKRLRPFEHHVLIRRRAHPKSEPSDRRPQLPTSRARVRSR
jgi:hypothetical protein